MSDECYEILEEREVPDVDVLIAGFPGTGLIGGIASEQLINSRDLEQIASINCDKFPPTAVIFEGIPRRPVRIFGDDDFLLIKADMAIPTELSGNLAKTIIRWCNEYDIEEAIILDGISQSGKLDEEERKTWGVLSTHTAKTEAEKLDLEVIERGAISGVSSSLLLEAHEAGLKAIGMFADAKTDMPDPKGSAALLDKLADYKDIDIDTQTLLESAEQLEEKYSQLIAKTKESQEDMEHKSAHPPLYG